MAFNVFSDSDLPELFILLLLMVSLPQYVFFILNNEHVSLWGPTVLLLEIVFIMSLKC